MSTRSGGTSHGSVTWASRPHPKRFVLVLLVGLLALGAIWREQISFVLWSAVSPIVMGIPTEKDRADADDAYQTILGAFEFSAPSVSVPNRMPVFCTPGSRSLITIPLKIRVYRVRTKPDQDRIVIALEKLRRERNTKPITIEFYEEENWMGTPGSGERGSETLTRAEVIK